MSGHVCESWARSVSKCVFSPWALQRISLEVRADHVLAHISIEQHFTCSRHRPQDRALVMFHSVRQHRRFLISLMLLASNSILASVCAYSIGFSRASALLSGLCPFVVWFVLPRTPPEHPRTFLEPPYNFPGRFQTS